MVLGSCQHGPGSRAINRSSGIGQCSYEKVFKRARAIEFPHFFVLQTDQASISSLPAILLALLLNSLLFFSTSVRDRCPTK